MKLIDRPLNDYVLIETSFSQEVTSHGIYLTNETLLESREGVVKHVSKDLKTKIKVGEKILFNSKSVIRTSFKEDEQMVLCSYFQIMMNLDTRMPYGDFVLVKPHEVPEETEDGVFLTEDMRKISGFSEVVSCSPDIPSDMIVPKKGDIVMHRKEVERETDMKDLGSEFLLRYKNLMAIMENE